MEYHDYHLRGYSVGDFGKTITLDLVYDYPGQPKRESKIIFSDVAAYRFIHAGGAIIIDLFEQKVSKAREDMDGLLEWSCSYAAVNDSKDIATCKAGLDKEGYRAWEICSAIGFAGIVIAKEVK